MEQHKHNRPCAHRHSDFWLPSKAHKPVTVIEPPLQGANSRRSKVWGTKQESRRVAKRRRTGGRDGGPGPCNGRGPRNRGRAGGQGRAGRAGGQGGAGREGG